MTSKKTSFPKKMINKLRVIRRALTIGLAAGLLQAALHQGSYWVEGRIDQVVVVRTLLSPLLTVTVAIISFQLSHPSK